MVAWMEHAETLRRHREIVLGLESDVIRLEGEIHWLARSRDQLQERLERIESRRSVRAVLAATRLLRPLYRALRRSA